jgi:hypothetical protein
MTLRQSTTMPHHLGEVVDVAEEEEEAAAEDGEQAGADRLAVAVEVEVDTLRGRQPE